MSGFKPYPAYKDSGVEWLGEVPEHWVVNPLKFYATCNDTVLPESTGDDYEIEYVEISDVNEFTGVTGSTKYRFADAPSRARRTLNDGDVLVSTVRTYLRAIAPVISPPKNLVASTGFAVVRPKPEFLSGTFLGYLLRAEWWVSEVISRSVGVSYPAINASDLIALPVPIPVLAEQTQIAQFLDHETARLGALAAEQQKLIELLKEKRQALISHAVTKGLDPNVPMKDSGVEWLGEVPEHWELLFIKHLASLNPKKSGFVGDREQLCSFVPMEKLKTGVVQLDEERTIQDVIDGYTYFEDGDVLQAKVTPCFENKNIAIAKNLTNGVGFGSSEINVLRPRQGVDAGYLYYRVQEDSYMDFCTSSMIGAGGLKRVPTDVINNFKVAVPESGEQTQIAQFLDQETSKLDALVAEAEQAIELIKERRSTLISAAVTGKIDVRNWKGGEP